MFRRKCLVNAKVLNVKETVMSETTHHESRPHVYSVWFERRDREGIAAAMTSFAERPAVVHAFVQAQLTYDLLRATEAQSAKLQQLLDLAAARDAESREWQQESRAQLETFKQLLAPLNNDLDFEEGHLRPLEPEIGPASAHAWLPPVEKVEESGLDTTTPAASPIEPDVAGFLDALTATEWKASNAD